MEIFPFEDLFIEIFSLKIEICSWWKGEEDVDGLDMTKIYS